ncbi:ATP-binding protein [Campylobacter fetus]|uniref:ATP-binding protein n=1 Tax=Campylobacter fetus TaxID=196 RepID=UPI0003D89F0E|nr:ATP-binding protein [Campylobacter fetus]AHE95207.1 hypothetical protein CFVI03293_A0082 [Campylobacter fetus subsp. venerealis cfvi03/293]
MINLLMYALAGFGGASALYFATRKNQQDDKNFKQCFLEKVATPLFSSFNEFYSNNELVITSIENDHICVNTPYPKLYGIEIVSHSTIPQIINEDNIQTLIRDYSEYQDAYFFYVLHKQGIYQKQYIFSHNSTMIKTISKFYDTKILSGNELSNAIFNTYLQNSYYIKNKQIHSNIEIDKKIDIENEPEFVSFKKLTKHAILNNMYETDIFQGYKHINAKTADIQKLFKINFQGSIWFYIDISKSHINSHIAKITNHAKMVGNKKPFLDLKEQFESGTEKLALINSMMFLKEYSEENISEISYALKTSFIHKELFRTTTFKKMPFKFRDGEFDFLTKASFLNNLITCVHKKPAKAPDIFGIDKQGAFINFSFSEENNNPHSVIIAKPGSGKSVSKQKIIAQMIGLDFSNGYCSNLGDGIGQVKVRSYDIGFSDEKLVNLIKSNIENKVAHIQSSMSHFSYNLLNLNDDNNASEFDEDLEFMTNLTNIILSTQKTETLDAIESGLFKTIVRNLYKNKSYAVSVIYNLRTDYPELYNELINLGYKENDKLFDIKETKYNFLKKPLLINAIKEIGVKAQDQQIDEIERKAYASLNTKLKAIQKLNIFDKYDKVDITQTDFLSMDLNNFKENELFVPIFFCIFQKTYLKDREFALKCKRENRPAPKLFYAIEEAKNYFRDSEIFVQMFDKVTLEARKYNVHLCFIVQNAEHIPIEILKNIDTRIFLLTPSQKEEVIIEADKSFKIPNNLKTALNQTEQYEMCVWYVKGVFNMKFQISNEEMKVFSTNPNQI